MASVMKEKRFALTEKIIVQKDITTGTDDAATTYGERVSDWATYWNGFGVVHTANSREVFRASQTMAICSHLIRIRYDNTSKDINERMRIIWGLRTLEISSVLDEDNKHRWLLLACNEAKT